MFYNHRGTTEQHIKEGKNAITWTRLSCHRFVANAVADRSQKCAPVVPSDAPHDPQVCDGLTFCQDTTGSHASPPVSEIRKWALQLSCAANPGAVIRHRGSCRLHRWRRADAAQQIQVCPEPAQAGLHGSHIDLTGRLP